MMQISAFVGYDYRWPMAYAVTVRSLLQKSSKNFPVIPLLLPHLQAIGAYDRPMHIKDNQMFDEISDAPMATEFANSRFLIPMLAQRTGFSLFCDSDFLFRADVMELFKQIDPSKAVTCVKHNYAPPETTKMNGQMQTLYARKNWSSMMIFNNEHPANNSLQHSNVNNFYGRDLHRFCWLDDDDIGEVGPEWNWLEGHSDENIDAKAVHFTRGTPDMKGFENVRYSDEWREVAAGINLCKEL